MPLVTIASNISEGLKKHEVVPDVVDEFNPKGLITVTYGSEGEVTMGNTLKIADTQHRPRVSLTLNEESEVNTNDKYSLVLTDPDAPSKGDNKWSEFAHYIVSDIPAPQQGTSVAEIDLSSAKELLPYMGPAPPPKTGQHRYVFVLYKQGEQPPAAIGESRPTWGTGTPGSGAREWAAKNGLTPVAINFYYAINQDQ